jgi:hypothetical protein
MSSQTRGCVSGLRCAVSVIAQPECQRGHGRPRGRAATTLGTERGAQRSQGAAVHAAGGGRLRVVEIGQVPGDRRGQGWAGRLGPDAVHGRHETPLPHYRRKAVGVVPPWRGVVPSRLRAYCRKSVPFCGSCQAVSRVSVSGTGRFLRRRGGRMGSSHIPGETSHFILLSSAVSCGLYVTYLVCCAVRTDLPGKPQKRRVPGHWRPSKPAPGFERKG